MVLCRVVALGGSLVQRRLNTVVIGGGVDVRQVLILVPMSCLYLLS